MLQPQKGFFVGDFLSNLDQGFPGMWRELLFAVITLGVDFLKLRFEGLLYGDFLIKSLFHLDLYEDSFRVLFRPDKVGLQQFELLKATEFLKTHSQKLLRVS